MTTPDDGIPGWLVADGRHGKQLALAYPMHGLVAEAADLQETETSYGNATTDTLEGWLAWRSRVATALGLVEPRPLAINAMEWAPRPVRFGYDEDEVVPGYGMSVWQDGGRSGCHAEVVMDDRGHENEIPAYAIFVDCRNEADARQVIEDHRHRAARPLIAAELRRLADELKPGHANGLVFPDGEIDGPAGDVSDWLRARADELDPPKGG